MTEVSDSHNIDSGSFRLLLKNDDPKLKALKSWWPFLCFSVASYGLALRGALLIFAGTKLRGALHALQFNHKDANALWHRLHPPLVVSGPDGKPPKIPSDDVPDMDQHESGACLALVANELALDEVALCGHLWRSFGWKLAKTVRVEIDNRRECTVQLEELRAASAGIAAVVIVAPMERDPIVAIALFVQDVIAAAGTQPEVLILLAGAGAEDRPKYWRDFIAIHGLHIGLERWTL